MTFLTPKMNSILIQKARDNMKSKLFSNGQYVKLSLHLRRQLVNVMPASEARAAVVRTCRNIRFDHEWKLLKQQGLAL